MVMTLRKKLMLVMQELEEPCFHLDLIPRRLRSDKIRSPLLHRHLKSSYVAHLTNGTFPSLATSILQTPNPQITCQGPKIIMLLFAAPKMYFRIMEGHSSG